MTPPNKKDALGKGIRSLLQNIDADLKSTAGSLREEVIENKKIQLLIIRSLMGYLNWSSLWSESTSTIKML